MQSRAIQHVTVWLDDSSLEDSTFPHALEWALCLNLPLRAVAMTGSNSERESRLPVLERIRAWGAACAQKGVPFETHLSVEPTQGAMDHFLRSCGLCVFGEPSTSRIQRDLFQRASSNPEICQLLCPNTYAPIRRVLILCHQTELYSAYLESAARICQTLETTPVILVVARTERDAQLKQGFAEGVFGAQRLRADFDAVVHGDLGYAVSRVVSWRNCSHVIVERLNDASWWERTSGKLVEQFREGSAPVSVFAIPESAALDVPYKIRRTQAILPWNRLQKAELVTTKEPV